MRAYLQVQEQLDEVFIWETGHSGREGCGGERKKFNLIIATLCLTTVILIDMLVERESVWTEISGLSEPRKLETPVFLGFYINSPVCLPFPP